MLGDINDCNNDKKNKLIIYDKKTKRSYGSTVYKSACENYFYDIDNVSNNKDKQIFEREFNNIECGFSILLSKFVNRCEQKENYYSALITNKKEREEFSFYLTMQLLRTKKFREIQGEFYQKCLDNKLYFYKLYKKNYLNEELDLNVNDIKINSKTLHLETLINNELIYELIYFIKNSYWTFIYNNTTVPFIISDNPVCRIPVIYEKEFGLELSSFMSEKFELYFPLSSKVVLNIYRKDSIFYKKLEGSIVNRLIPINISEVIDSINKYQWIMSNEKIFLNPNNIDLIERYCNENIMRKTNLLF